MEILEDADVVEVVDAEDEVDVVDIPVLNAKKNRKTMQLLASSAKQNSSLMAYPK